jgi:hypothetical protein
VFGDSERVGSCTNLPLHSLLRTDSDAPSRAWIALERETPRQLLGMSDDEQVIRKDVPILNGAGAFYSSPLHGQTGPVDLLHRYCGVFAEESGLNGRVSGDSISADNRGF